MKVLLIQDVKGLGKCGEIKDVKDGYANNFLIAKGFAKSATHSVIRQFEASKQRQKEELQYEITQSQKQKEELKNVKIIIKTKLGANGALFGSVTKDDIFHAFKEQKGYEIDKKAIECGHIKATGIYDIGLRLKHGISAKFTLEVAGE